MGSQQQRLKTEQDDDKIEYGKLLIPFQTFLETVPFGLERFSGDKKNDGPIAAFKALQILTQRIVDYAACLPVEKKQQWERLRKKLKYSLIKDTKKYGTTSASMGFAQFAQISTKKKEEKLMVTANCGTGGIKIGFYKHCNGVMRAVCDDLKGGENMPSINAVALGSWQPENYKPEDWETQRNNLRSCLRLIYEKIQQLAKDGIGNVKSKQVNWAAFVTGPARQAWENADTDNKNAMEQSLIQFFKDTPFDNNCVFMPQTQEAELEFLATKTLISNLEKKNRLGLASNQKCCVLASFGVGQGSLQAGTILCPFGMKNANVLPQKLNDHLKVDTIHEFIEHSLNVYEEYLQQIYTETENADFDVIPVIALKSGMLLLTNANDEFLAEVLEKARECMVSIDSKLSDDVKTNTDAIPLEPPSDKTDYPLVDKDDSEEGDEGEENNETEREDSTNQKHEIKEEKENETEQEEIEREESANQKPTPTDEEDEQESKKQNQESENEEDGGDKTEREESTNQKPPPTTDEEDEEPEREEESKKQNQESENEEEDGDKTEREESKNQQSPKKRPDDESETEKEESTNQKFRTKKRKGSEREESSANQEFTNKEAENVENVETERAENKNPEKREQAEKNDETKIQEEKDDTMIVHTQQSSDTVLHDFIYKTKLENFNLFALEMSKLFTIYKQTLEYGLMAPGTDLLSDIACKEQEMRTKMQNFFQNLF